MAKRPADIFADSPSLDGQYYSLEDDELAFFKSQTGIEDDVALKQHIIAVSKKAYEVSNEHAIYPFQQVLKRQQMHGYPCIRTFAFTRYTTFCLPSCPGCKGDAIFYRLKISRIPAYSAVLKLSRERKDAILLDIGCCCEPSQPRHQPWPFMNVEH